MIKIDDLCYERLATKFIDESDDDGYFSGSISYEHQGMECTFIASILIYHKRGDVDTFYGVIPLSEICNLVPIWWEFETLCDGEIVPNDFDFELLKDAICPS